MEHSFDVEHAKEHGFVAAVLIRHLQFWLIKNKEDKRNQHDEHTWTYSSVAALCRIFPYFGRSQIIKALNLLVDKGILAVGNYNTHPHDRTKWYTFVDEATFLVSRNADAENRKSNSGNERALPDSCSSDRVPDKSPPTPQKVKQQRKQEKAAKEEANRAAFTTDVLWWNGMAARGHVKGLQVDAETETYRLTYERYCKWRDNPSFLTHWERARWLIENQCVWLQQEWQPTFIQFLGNNKDHSPHWECVVFDGAYQDVRGGVSEDEGFVARYYSDLTDSGGTPLTTADRQYLQREDEQEAKAAGLTLRALLEQRSKQ